MSKLSIDQKTILTLFEDKKSNFLIPDYQRPYAWGEEECQTLWDDIFAFAFPNGSFEGFDDSEEEYYLGSIVTFRNEKNKLEVIDGQQRLTTLLLLLRAFYVKFENMHDEKSNLTRERISRCIWKTDEVGKANDLSMLKIDSEVATDDEKEDFLKILKTGKIVGTPKSKYAYNFQFFQDKIEKFASAFPMYYYYLPTRILMNCILLPIEANSQNTALRIFSTLNDRGKPLSDTDIFKNEFYKFYRGQSEDAKKKFVADWKDLEECCGEVFTRATGAPMDELFTRYMYYERAKQGIKSSTTEALRRFYGQHEYRLLKKEETFNNLKILVDFWEDVSNRNKDCFSDEVLKKLFILNYAPNGMWTYFVSVYFMHNKDKDGKLDNKNFEKFLSKITAFIWTYAITNPGVNALRTPIYAEMMNIVNDKPVDFVEHKFDLGIVKGLFENYSFNNGRPITKSILTWWAFINPEQALPKKINTSFDIEHIFSVKRQENDKTLSNERYLELLGNKSLLEKRINISASDYKFSDKIKYYQGFTNSKGKSKEGTQINDLVTLSKNHTDFTEKDIIERNNQIIDRFLLFLKENDLVKGE